MLGVGKYDRRLRVGFCVSPLLEAVIQTEPGFNVGKWAYSCRSITLMPPAASADVPTLAPIS